MERQYVYRVVEILKITDGDTYWVYVDVGFRETKLIEVRLNGYDTPESAPRSEKYVKRGLDVMEAAARQAIERDRAAQAKALANAYLVSALQRDDLWVKTYKADDFGRWLADVWTEGTTTLGEQLHSAGLASVWPTRWHEGFN